MLRRYFVVVALAAGFVGTGCVSISHVQTADTLGQGKSQFAVEPGAGGTAVFSGGEAVDSDVYPHVDLAYRYGVTDTLDLGVRFGSSLLELQGKILLTDPADPDRAISLAPSVMGFFFGSGGDNVNYVNVALPVLIGFKTGNGSELVLGPRVTGTSIAIGSRGDTGRVSVLSLGTSVGYALRVSEGFRLLPEVAVLFPLVGNLSSSNTDSDVVAGFAGGFVQFKLGFLFGRGRPISPPAPEGNFEPGTAQPEAPPEGGSEH